MCSSSLWTTSYDNARCNSPIPLYLFGNQLGWKMRDDRLEFTVSRKYRGGIDPGSRARSLSILRMTITEFRIAPSHESRCASVLVYSCSCCTSSNSATPLCVSASCCVPMQPTMLGVFSRISEASCSCRACGLLVGFGLGQSCTLQNIRLKPVMSSSAMTFIKLASPALILFSSVTSSKAQEVGGTVAGSVTGGVIFALLCLFLLFLCLYPLGRRRMGYGYPGVTLGPMFWGPWFRPHGHEGPPPQEQWSGYGGPQFAGGTPVQPQRQYSQGYPGTPPPPPPYKADGPRLYSPPPGPPPFAGAYAPPPGPPPPAHTKGSHNGSRGESRS
ncbi:hypothetical protein LshimejAT787_1300130 [Lyophyllum shimeji]|uniref:Uncharacterized protein n=1 Tax=Lyophyllum shimeji TaxID=47721 RepID=A0A9P3PXL8_LYOSH|nr:hypothetical protein LshimejAT787_1300130 [Lyophyllum shimeji]